jgi:predicted nucleotidyltransferase
MAGEPVHVAIRRYLQAVRKSGLQTSRAVLFGSHARGDADEWSDIDLIVISPDLDGEMDRKKVALLWELRAITDSRIEPIPSDEKEWEGESARPIIEIARLEGIVIEA